MDQMAPVRGRASPWTVLCVYVDSTLLDFKHERNVLHLEVYPWLPQLCEDWRRQLEAHRPAVERSHRGRP